MVLLLEMEEEIEENEVEGFVVEKMEMVGGGNGRPRSLVEMELAVGACRRQKG